MMLSESFEHVTCIPACYVILLGERDMAGDAQPQMRPFPASRTDALVDTASTVRERPIVAQRVVKQVVSGFKDGKFRRSVQKESLRQQISAMLCNYIQKGRASAK